MSRFKEAKTVDRIVLSCEASPPAMALARMVTDQLEVLHPKLSVEVRPFRGRSSRRGGRRPPGRSLRVLEDKSVDAVLLSFEDLPGELPAGIEIAVVSERLTPYQALVSPRGMLLDELEPGARVGVLDDLSRFQLLGHRSDLDVVSLRQSLDSNLKKVRAGKLDALIAPVSDLELLGWQNAVSEVLDSSLFLPPAGRGISTLLCRQGSRLCEKWLSALEDSDTRSAMVAERTLQAEMNGLDGLLGALADISGRTLHMEAAVWGPDGREVTRDSAKAGLESAAALGRILAESLCEDGAERLMRRGRRWSRALEKIPSSSGAEE